MNRPPGAPAGGAHPHAGFEIATFLVEGEVRDRDEGVLKAGDVLWMTAGSGVIRWKSSASNMRRSSSCLTTTTSNPSARVAWQSANYLTVA